MILFYTFTIHSFPKGSACENLGVNAARIYTQFGIDFQRDLNILYQSELGRNLVRSIHSSNILVQVENASSFFYSDKEDVLNSETRGDGLEGWKVEHGVINLQYSQRAGVQISNTTAYSFLVLAHEFVHAKDIATGFYSNLIKRVRAGEIDLPHLDVKNEIAEVRAMIYTNRIRIEHDLGEVRTEYNGVKLLEDDGVTPIKDYGFDITEELFEEEVGDEPQDSNQN